MRKLLNRKVVEQAGKCAICHHEFVDCGDIVPDHRHPKGIGGARRDDRPEKSKPCIGRATQKRDRPERENDGRSLSALATSLA
jgi:hypothetical protein